MSQRYLVTVTLREKDLSVTFYRRDDNHVKRDSACFEYESEDGVWRSFPVRNVLVVREEPVGEGK